MQVQVLTGSLLFTLLSSTSIKGRQRFIEGCNSLSHHIWTTQLPWQQGPRPCVCIPPHPPVGLDGGEEVQYRTIEQLRLLQIGGVAALRKDHQARPGEVTFHEDRGLDTGLILIADHDQRGHIKGM